MRCDVGKIFLAQAAYYWHSRLYFLWSRLKKNDSSFLYWNFICKKSSYFTTVAVLFNKDVSHQRCTPSSDQRKFPFRNFASWNLIPAIDFLRQRQHLCTFNCINEIVNLYSPPSWCDWHFFNEHSINLPLKRPAFRNGVWVQLFRMIRDDS